MSDKEKTEDHKTLTEVMDLINRLQKKIKARDWCIEHMQYAMNESLAEVKMQRETLAEVDLEIDAGHP